MADFRDFKFTGEKLEDTDLPRIGSEIGIGEDIIHAIMDVEATGSSTDANGRIKALYEPHIAYRNSSGAVRAQLVQAGLAYPKWKRHYPRDSYPRIQAAMEIDETVALLATSWGFPQVLGSNYALAGYDTVQAMVHDMLESEAQQLSAMIGFIKGAGLDGELRVLQAKLDQGQRITPDDARPFVRGYNGAEYAKNNYHVKFAEAVNKWAKIPDTPWQPSDKPVGIDPKASLYDGAVHPEVKAVQKQLNDLGYPEIGSIDGRWGSKTRAALLAFRADNGLPLNPVIDNSLLAALMTAKPRDIHPARTGATIADLRKKGAPDVAAADKTQIAGGVTVAGGAVAAASNALDSAQQYSDIAHRAVSIFAPLQNFIHDNLWLLLIGVGGVIIWQSGVLKQIRIDKHHSGEDVSE